MGFTEDVESVLDLILGGDVEVYAEGAGGRIEWWKGSLRGLVVRSPGGKSDSQFMLKMSGSRTRRLMRTALTYCLVRFARRMRGPVREMHSRLESRHLPVFHVNFSFNTNFNQHEKQVQVDGGLQVQSTYLRHTPGFSLGWHRILVALQASQAV